MADERNDWREAVKIIVAKCEVGAAFGQRVCFNADGADALGKLLKQMAYQLDHAYVIDVDQQTTQATEK